MVAEGTDIPRLQVCCHVSRIRTELHFRQVLGRVLRRIGDADTYAWMYVFGEPSLSEFAARVADDLPLDRAVLPEVEPRPLADMESPGCMSSDDVSLEEELELPCVSVASGNNEAESYPPRGDRDLVFSEHFRHQLLAIF
jgi:superfamily II DNA or RNA helicase